VILRYLILPITKWNTSIQTIAINDFCDWIWASCNYTPFMSLLSKNGCQYADGGFGDLNLFYAP
jgi:hypothetical protein